jgi:predicted extracellular nuclease
MKKPVASIPTPGQLSVLAALLAGMSCAAIAAPADVVISQVYGGGGNSGSVYRNDFIEVFNRSLNPVTLSGWSVQYGSAGGTTWQVTALPDMILQPGKYILVQEAAQGGQSAPLPTPDASGALLLSATNGKVALVRSRTPLSGANPPNTAYLDLVGFGTTNGSEGAATATPSNSTAVLRKDSGCVDSDVNSDDFVVGDPSPHNNASASHVCGLPVLTCPDKMSVLVGRSATVGLSAFDTDSVVNNAVIKSGGVAGMNLAGFAPSSANGASATVSLGVTSAVPLGSYAVEVEFSNDHAPVERTSCTINVSVQQLPPVTLSIPKIQGPGDVSTNLGVQTTDGIATKVVSTGFFLQDPAGDGDAATSDAIFVYMGNTPFSVAEGDAVRVTGTVVEFKPTGAPRSVTEISNPTTVLVRADHQSVAPTNIDFPGAGLARYEGMLVHVNTPLIVNDNSSLGDRGELTLASVRREVPTNHYRPKSAEALALAASNAADQIVLDDGIIVQSAVIPFVAADNTVRTGDTITDLVGVVDYGSIGNSKFGFKLQPVSVPSVTFSRSNPRTAGPDVPLGNLRIASGNVLNFFTVFTDGTDVNGNTGQGCSLGSSVSKSNCRGADSMEEFKRQRDKIVTQLKALNADVVGLMEIQNNGNTTVDYLVGQLNLAVGANTYAAVKAPSFSGTDAIRVAMIYKPAVVTPVGDPIADPDTAINERAPMAQTFKAGNGAKFSVIVNHLKSKACGSATLLNLDQLDGQGCWNPRRVQQAERLRDIFIPQVIAAAGDPDVLLIGDFNAHGFEDPIDRLVTGSNAANAMVNELERHVRPNGIVYSYVFDGLLGYLDHAIATRSLDAQVIGATEWHNNADEPEVIDYNFNLGTSKNAKPQDLYVANAYRASDHDPVVISLNLTPTFIDATAGFSVTRSSFVLNRQTGLYSGTYAFTNPAAAPVNGPFQLEIAGLPAGVTLTNATGKHNGVPYITTGGAALAPGATVTTTLTLSNPNKVGINYSATIYSGNF